MRLIDIDAMRKPIYATDGNIIGFEMTQDERDSYNEGINYALRLAANCPTVDAVPVVRCRDCIHYEMGVCLKIYDDGALNKDAWQKRNPNDYCSYGECKPTHCKDCKWWDSNSWGCSHPVHGSPLSTPDFFCTDGERKGGNE